MLYSFLLALVSLFAISNGCSFTVNGYLNNKCTLKLETRTFANQVPNVCQKGANANYPYYIWKCANNGIQLTYYTDAACTKAAPNPEPIYYNNQCCGPSPANSNAYVITQINACCTGDVDTNEIEDDDNTTPNILGGLFGPMKAAASRARFERFHAFNDGFRKHAQE